MTYSHEVEHMCVVKKGPNPRTGSHTRRRQMGKIKRNS